jgi:predicted cupin superfamily sugar epimerase
MKYTSKDWIEKLGLIPHPEGGFYKEVYRSDETIAKSALPERYGGDRKFSTSIYYLLRGKDFSAFHKLKSDEIWHFYYGSSLIVHIFDSDGKYEQKNLGVNFEKEEEPQLVILRGSIFAAEVSDKNSFTLIGCTVAPGFDFADFELCKQEELLELYPDYSALIKRLTRK